MPHGHAVDDGAEQLSRRPPFASVLVDAKPLGQRSVNKGDPAVQVYESDIVTDPDYPGQTMAQFDIPAVDTDVTGAFWWRVDCVDVLNKRRTANCGTLLVEAV